MKSDEQKNLYHQRLTEEELEQILEHLEHELEQVKDRNGEE